uniref:gliding motility-associated C-terminal domain-containing protein n=1 Tax=uncultured Tenacibaculum sp. TaxID=174713 RepID=UPI002612C856
TTTTTAICESTTKTLVGSPAGGTWSVESGGGSISGTTYTPANITSDTNVTIRYTIPANGSCSATTADVSFTVNSDCNPDDDNDGNPDTTDPNPLTPTTADDALTVTEGTTGVINVLANDDFLPSPNTSLIQTGGTAGGTVVFDPLTGELSYTPLPGEQGTTVTVEYQVCNTAVTPNVCETATVTITVQGDNDGDGDPDITDPDDDNDGNPDTTDPNPLTPTAADDSLTVTEGTTGVINVLANDDFLPGPNTTLTQTGGTAGGTVIFDPLTGELSYTPLPGEQGTTVTVEYQVCNTAVTPNVCETATVTITVQGDNDGDGDPDITDPDDDNDGNPDTTDPNPLTPTAADDALTVTEGTTGVINVLANDDFLPGPNTTLTQTGGTAGGTVVFDPLTGELSYTPLPGEQGTTVTVEYQVCNTAVTPNICETATVIITVQGDNDGDGDPDITDPDDDNDGNPDTTDPNPLTPTAADDALTVTEGTTGVINVLANDDFLPGPNTTLTQTGGTAGGTVVFDPLTGELSYTPLPGEQGTTVTVEYQVCNTTVTPNICETATVIITVQGDNDGDGIIDSIDIDDDNDGILDTEEGDGTVDTDGDGIPDSMDTDSDNDGVLDVIEGNDANGDGIPDDIPSGDDTDGDGLDDAFDPDNGGTPVDIPDTDGDGTPDYQDTDDDDDGIDTIDENPGDSDITTDDSLDTNNNGIPDYLDPDTNPCGTPYNILTPDNDGENDTFFISCIDNPKYSNNTVEIFNRWGNIVYKAKGYNNIDVVFRGISNGRSTINVDEKLPPGTYYYVIDLGDGSNPKVGWLYINR